MHIANRRMHGINQREVGSFSNGNFPSVDADRLSSAFRGLTVEIATDGEIIRSQDRSPPGRQALAVFENAKFFPQVNAAMRVASNAEATVSGQKLFRLENPVSEVGFGCRAKTNHGFGLRDLL